VRQFVINSLMIVSLSTGAQRSSLPYLTVEMPAIACPAAISMTNQPLATLLWRKQNLNLPGSPESAHIGLSSPLNHSVRLAILVSDETAGIFRNTELSGVYSYGIKFAKSSTFALAVAGGFRRQFADISKIRAERPEEFAAAAFPAAMTPQASFGALFAGGGTSVLLSATSLLSGSFRFTDPFTNTQMTMSHVPEYFLCLTHYFRKNKICIAPSVILRSVQGLPPLIDGAVSLKYKELVFLTPGYRLQAQVAYVTAGFRVTDQVTFFYGFGSGPVRAGGGSHEVGLTFRRQKPQNLGEPEKGVPGADAVMKALDENHLELEAAAWKIDSLNNRVASLEKAIDTLKARQLSARMIDSLIHKTDSAIRSTRKIPVPSSLVQKLTQESDTSGVHTSAASRYRLVYGVYRHEGFASAFIQFLRKRAGIDASPVRLAGLQDFIYVCVDIPSIDLAGAVREMTRARTSLRALSEKITNGEPWILILND
jgi:type IX secretion system PorP/SprF family membrane protein